MCARYVFFSGKIIKDEFGVTPLPDLEPRYNIAPSQFVPVIVETASGRAWREFRWGLVPGWSATSEGQPPLINARAETIAERPAFREAFARRRCLIPADGFYEWTGDKVKQPHYITLQPERPFAFAGIWEEWGTGDQSLVSCAIVTTGPNAMMGQIHTRMPVILKPADHGLWLNASTEPREALELLRPYEGEMKMRPVDRAVGNPKREGPELIAPLATLFGDEW